jgi:hypothetical protein
MRIRSARWMVMVLVLGTGVSLSADRVRLRSGKVVEGMFMGGDSKSVRVLLDNGSVSEIPLEAQARAGTAADSRPGVGSQGSQGCHRPGGHSAERTSDTGDRRRRLAGRPELQGGRR